MTAELNLKSFWIGIGACLVAGASAFGGWFLARASAAPPSPPSVELVEKLAKCPAPGSDQVVSATIVDVGYWTCRSEKVVKQ